MVYPGVQGTLSLARVKYITAISSESRWGFALAAEPPPISARAALSIVSDLHQTGATLSKGSAGTGTEGFPRQSGF